MSIDKFGSHLFKKSIETAPAGRIYNVVDIKNASLYYNLILPFLGIYNKSTGKYELLQDKRTHYQFLLKDCIIIGSEFPPNVTLEINNVPVTNPISVKLKQGDKISFKQEGAILLKQFYGELLLKCLIEIE